jgi:hypothetical protein
MMTNRVLDPVCHHSMRLPVKAYQKGKNRTGERPETPVGKTPY